MIEKKEQINSKDARMTQGKQSKGRSKSRRTRIKGRGLRFQLFGDF